MRPTFDLCQTKLKIELESCRRRFRTYSGAFWIGAEKKLNFFSGTSMAPSNVEYVTIRCNQEIFVHVMYRPGLEMG